MINKTKSKFLKSILTSILRLSVIGTITTISTSCNEGEQHSSDQKSGPRLDKSNLDLSVGNKEVINVLGLDDKETSVTWKSSDESLATVQEESGNSTSIIANSDGKTGQVDITATIKIADNTFVLTCKVNVTMVPLESISFASPTADIKVGDIIDLTIECTPTNASIKSVEVRSSNKRFVNIIVSDGKSTTFQVKGLSEGSETITAYVDDYSGKQIKATCKINVKQGLIPVEGVELDVDEFVIRVNESRKLKATVCQKMFLTKM